MATFNSRYLTYKALTEQFVPTQHFKRLMLPSHSILLGARGSGKTTMLKMLQPEAEDLYKEKYPGWDYSFYGIYIPSDRQWSFVLEELDEASNPQSIKNISKGLVNLNILLAFLESLHYVLGRKEVSETDKFEFCKNLMRFWHINDDIPPMIEFIRMCLRGEAIKIQNAINDKDTDYNLPFVCKTPFVDTLSQALDIVEYCFSKYDLRTQWALCFDEMEIAPEWLKEEIINLDLRSRDQRLLFKITSTPDWRIAINRYRDASENNDIDVIKCWNTEAGAYIEWKTFCDSIIKSQILDKYGISKEEFFSLLSVEKKDRNFFLEHLPSVDDGFGKFFLRDKDFDAQNIITISRASMRSKYYQPMVLASRYFHFGKIKGKPVADDYSYLGEWMLYSMPDGNPRSLMNILKMISYQMESRGKLRMNIPALGKMVRDFSRQSFDERFSYSPMPAIDINGNKLSFYDILYGIGDYFKNELLGEHYNPDPKTMFTFDNKSLFKDFIHIGLSVGAIVMINDKLTYSGQRPNGVYRLSYMLYPLFGYVSNQCKVVAYLEDIFKINEE